MSLTDDVASLSIPADLGTSDFTRMLKERYGEKLFQVMGEELRRLGWSEFELKVEVQRTYGNGAESERHFYGLLYRILTEKIEVKKTPWIYHGTSTRFWESIFRQGLNNARGPEANPGVMERVRNGATYTGNLTDAQHFGELTSNKLSGKPMLLRWPAEQPVWKTKIGATSRPVPSAELEYSLDGGKTWKPMSERPER